MKKVVIVYSSKSGATKACGEYLASRINGSQLIDLNEVTPDISSYDTVLIGSGVRMAKIYKPVKKFLAKNADVLNSKQSILFLSNHYPETVTKTLQKCVPQELSQLDVLECGGVPPFNKITDDTWMKKTEIDAALMSYGLL